MSENYPEWLIDQRGKAYRSPGYLNRNSLIRCFALYLRETDREVRFDEIRKMLLFLDRDYSMGASQISRALAPLYRSESVAKAPKGKAVRIDGRTYRSARAAAEELGVSPQTVLNRIRSGRKGWDVVD